jgi:hypothetical protein
MDKGPRDQRKHIQSNKKSKNIGFFSNTIYNLAFSGI